MLRVTIALTDFGVWKTLWGGVPSEEMTELVSVALLGWLDRVTARPNGRQPSS